MDSTLTLIIADDHLIVRQGIEGLLRAERTIRCVAVASNGDEVLPLVEQFRPQMLLLDLSMPGMSTLDILRHCREHYPQMRLVVLTMHATAFSVSEVFRAGAHGFVAKDEASDSLIRTIKAVAAGEENVCVSLDSAYRASIPSLTPREIEVMQDIALGMSTKEIADRLGISSKTVELYRTRLLRKFGLTKATELVRLALESGMLPQSRISENMKNLL